jgi:hypothetical protein
VRRMLIDPFLRADYKMLDDQEWLPSHDDTVKCSSISDCDVKSVTHGVAPLQLTFPTWDNCLAIFVPTSSTPLLLHIIDHLDNGRPSGFNIGDLGTFFSYIPSRLGHSRVLDDAVQCICTAYSALLKSDGSMGGQDRHEYYQALRSLRLACLDKEEVLTSNVLCAAVLLSWYEVNLALNLL